MRLSLYWLTLAGLPACAQRASVAQQPTAQQPTFTKPRTVSTIPINTAPSDTVLVYRRTPCYGTCPSYTATVFRNGRVEYNGERFVPVTGAHTFKLPADTVTRLLAAARRIGFNDLPPRYKAKVTDLPATVVAVYQPGQARHEVFAERGAAPEKLQQYLDYLQHKFDPLAGLTAK